MCLINVVPEDEFKSKELKRTVFQCRNARRECCVQEIALILFQLFLDSENGFEGIRVKGQKGL